MYWPGETTSNGVSTVSAVAVPLPAGVTSASNPTIVPRPSVTSGTTVVPQVDLVFSGELGTASNADIITARYTLTVNANGTATLAPSPSLPVTTLPGTVAASAPTLPTVSESLTAGKGNATWQARDIAWYRDPNAFELSMITNAGGASTVTPLVPAGSAATYDRASGQWVFVINWTALGASGGASSTINSIAEWWTGWNGAAGTSPTNVIVYTNPSLGTVTFSTPLPANNPATGFTFGSLNLNINPEALRATFQSQSNTAPISFIDDQYKPNAAPGQPNVITSRYWYIYRKQSAVSGSSAAASSVLYYDTRRLTLTLPYPVQLSYSAAGASQYTLTAFTVTDSATTPNDVTSQVDVDWARGRVYFPETYTVGSASYNSEGQTFTVKYTYTAAGSAPSTSVNGSSTGIVTWQDEPLYNSPTATSVTGEHLVPINAPANESDPSAFLDPLAGSGGSSLTINPSTATPSNLSGQPYPHKVWLFWTSTRNASTTNGAGSDIYWETLDPRFEVINP